MGKEAERKKPTGDKATSSPAVKPPRKTVEDAVELAGEDSFPASDPPSYGPVTHSGRP